MNGIERFRLFVSDFSSVSSVLTKLAVIFPLADLALKVGPPEPKGVPFFTSAGMLLTLMFIFQYWSGLDRQALNRRFLGTLSGFLILAIAYTLASGAFIESRTPAQGSPERAVLGYEIAEPFKSYVTSALAAEKQREDGERQEQQQQRYRFSGCRLDLEQQGASIDAIRERCFSGDPIIPVPAKSRAQIESEMRDLYLKQGGAPASFYTRGSRAILDVLLLSLWIGMFASLVACLCAFALAIRPEADAQPDARA